MGATQLLARFHDYQNRSTDERVIKGQLLSRLPFLFVHLECGNWRASACLVFESHNQHDWYAVVVVRDGLAVRLYPRQYQGYWQNLQVLIKGVFLELILSFENICLINFHGFIDPRKFFNNEKYPDYGMCFIVFNFLVYPLHGAYSFCTVQIVFVRIHTE